MNWDLYNKYGERNQDGYYIDNHEKWHYYAQRPELYNRKKNLAYLWLLVPVGGVVPFSLAFEEMGLSVF